MKLGRHSAVGCLGEEALKSAPSLSLSLSLLLLLLLLLLPLLLLCLCVSVVSNPLGFALFCFVCFWGFFFN